MSLPDEILEALRTHGKLMSSKDLLEAGVGDNAVQMSTTLHTMFVGKTVQRFGKRGTFVYAPPEAKVPLKVPSKPKSCLCGCGRLAKPNMKFIHGHSGWHKGVNSWSKSKRQANA